MSKRKIVRALCPDKGTEKAALPVGTYIHMRLRFCLTSTSTATAAAAAAAAWLESVSAVVFSVFVDNSSVIEYIKRSMSFQLDLVCVHEYIPVCVIACMYVYILVKVLFSLVLTLLLTKWTPNCIWLTCQLLHIPWYSVTSTSSSSSVFSFFPLSLFSLSCLSRHRLLLCVRCAESKHKLHSNTWLFLT